MSVLLAKYRPEVEKLLRNADKLYQLERSVPFASPAGGHRPWLQIRGCRRYRGAAVQFLEMKLIYATTVALRNRNEIVIDLNLFTLLGQMT